MNGRYGSVIPVRMCGTRIVRGSEVRCSGPAPWTASAKRFHSSTNYDSGTGAITSKFLKIIPPSPGIISMLWRLSPKLGIISRLRRLSRMALNQEQSQSPHSAAKQRSRALIGRRSKAQGVSPGFMDIRETSPEGAAQQSPGRKPWVHGHPGD